MKGHQSVFLFAYNGLDKYKHVLWMELNISTSIFQHPLEYLIV
jgi:hypothetical protein